MTSHRELYDSVKNTVAKLYVLRDSCTGIIHTEKPSQDLRWFQGAAAMLQGAVDELQKALRALEEEISIAEKERKDWAHVERLIKKLDKFYDTRISVALEDPSQPESRGQRTEDRRHRSEVGGQESVVRIRESVVRSQ